MATWQLGLAYAGHHTVFPGNVWKYKTREFWKHLEKPKSSEGGTRVKGVKGVGVELLPQKCQVCLFLLSHCCLKYSC